MKREWYSAMLRFVILERSRGATSIVRSVVVFLADGFPEAKTRAIELGNAMETEYVGGTGDDIRWRLDAVETIDWLGEAIADGREVYFEPGDLPQGCDLPFDHQFAPEESKPDHSGV